MMETVEGWIIIRHDYPIMDSFDETIEGAWENIAIEPEEISACKEQGYRAVKIRVEQIGEEE